MSEKLQNKFLETLGLSDEREIKFVSLLADALGNNKNVSIFEVTLDTGLDKNEDDEVFYPLVKRLVEAKMLSAYTELSYDSERMDTVQLSKKDGVLSSSGGYSDDELEKILEGVTKEFDTLYTHVIVKSLVKAEELETAKEVTESTPSPQAEQTTEAPKEADQETPPQERAQEAVAENKELATTTEVVQEATQDDSVKTKDSSKNKFSSGAVFKDNTKSDTYAVIRSKVSAKTSSCDVYLVADELSTLVETALISHTKLNKEYSVLSDAEAKSFLENLNKQPASISTQSDAKSGDDESSAPQIKSNETPVLEVSQATDSPQQETLQENEQESTLESEPSEQPQETQDAQPAKEEEVKIVLKDQVVGRTRAAQKRMMVAALGAVVSISAVTFLISEKNRLFTKVDTIERELKAPTAEFKVIRTKDYEALKQEIADLTVMIGETKKSAQMQVSVERSKIQAEFDKKLKDAEAEAARRGKEEALGLSTTVRERMGLMVAKKAVVNGSCDAYGRGNRIDKIYPVNFAVDVDRWIIDPVSLKVTGVEGHEKSLMETKDAPVTYIRCDIGPADVWPSYGEPVLGEDKTYKPVDSEGKVVETNPLLQKVQSNDSAQN